MNAYRHRVLLVLAACLTLVAGRSQASEPGDTTALKASVTSTPQTHPKLAVGSKLRDCDMTFDGPGPVNWRKTSLSVGPFGLLGPKPGPDFDRGTFEGGLLTVKTPTLVAGHRPVTISVPPAQRYRFGILGVNRRRPAYASVTYVPCDDKLRTVFPAGLLLRDRRPVTLRVHVGNGPVRVLYVNG